jgi:hypothetical protein
MKSNFYKIFLIPSFVFFTIVFYIFLYSQNLLYKEYSLKKNLILIYNQIQSCYESKLVLIINIYLIFTLFLIGFLINRSI